MFTLGYLLYYSASESWRLYLTGFIVLTQSPVLKGLAFCCFEFNLAHDSHKNPRAFDNGVIAHLLSPSLTRDRTLSNSTEMPDPDSQPLSIEKVPFDVLSLIARCLSAPRVNHEFIIGSTLSRYGDAFWSPREYLKLDTLKSMRLVSKTFNLAASPFLISHVTISQSQESKERLNMIADHPVFSKFVSAIDLDCHLLYEDFTVANYVAALNSKGTFCQFPKSKLREGYEEYRQIVENQRSFREQKLHIEALLNAFEKMPNLKTVALFEKSFGRLNRRRLHILRSNRDSDASTAFDEDYMVEPSPNYYIRARDDNGTAAHRKTLLTLMGDYLLLLSRPEIFSRIKTLKLLTFNLSHHLDAMASTFGSAEKFQEALRNVFEGLESIHLNTSSGYSVLTPTRAFGSESANKWGKIINSGLKHAQQLRALYIEFPTSYTPVEYEVSSLIGDLYFPHLRIVHVAGDFQASTLFDFITRHESTLKDIVLGCSLIGGTWRDFFAKLKEEGNLHVDNFVLTHCSQRIPRQQQQGQNAPHHVLYPAEELHQSYRVSSKEALNYLYHDGFNPVTPVTEADLLGDEAEDTDTGNGAQ